MNVILMLLTWLSASLTGAGSGSRVFYVIFYVVYFLIAGIFSSSSAYLYLNIVNERPAFGSMIFYCFRYYTDRSVLVTLFKLCAEALCCIVMLLGYSLFISQNEYVYLGVFTVGAVIAVAGSLVIEAMLLPAYYLIHDFPEYKAMDIIALCPRLMKGSVARTILLFISLIPIRLLELLSFGVAAPWVESYAGAIYAEFYMDIMKVYLMRRD